MTEHEPPVLSPDHGVSYAIRHQAAGPWTPALLRSNMSAADRNNQTKLFWVYSSFPWYCHQRFCLVCRGRQFSQRILAILKVVTMFGILGSQFLRSFFHYLWGQHSITKEATNSFCLHIFVAGMLLDTASVCSRQLCWVGHLKLKPCSIVWSGFAQNCGDFSVQ